MPKEPINHDPNDASQLLEYERLDDAELIAAARRDDTRAMEVLFLRHKDFAYRSAYGVLGNHEDAAEVVQDVFHKFFLKVNKLELRGKFTTYLYKMVRNRSIDFIRKRKPTIELFDEHAAPPVRDPERERRALLDMVGHLPEKQRDVVILRFGEGMQIDEIAETLRVASGTVKSRLHTAIASLREQWET